MLSTAPGRLWRAHYGKLAQAQSALRRGTDKGAEALQTALVMARLLRGL
jgi:hypothetical protein